MFHNGSKGNRAYNLTVRRFEKKVKDMLDDRSVRRVVVGLSGGADSTALLAALVASGVALAAVHCNFHLRGPESDRDRDFCVSLCARLGVELRVADFDTDAYRREHRVSVEMACRELRYAFFREVLTETGADRIAVAHNSDDNAETVLLNLMRGAGVTGLRGMLPDSGEIIRPLLSTSRHEIIEYLGEKRLDHVTDSTNLESDYRRNFLRNEVIPLLETRWPAAKMSINRSAANLLHEEAVLKELSEHIENKKNSSLQLYSITRHADPYWVIYRFIKPRGGNSAQAAEILAAVTSDTFTSGKQWRVTGGRVCLERDRLEFVEDSDDGADFEIEIREFADEEIDIDKIKAEGTSVLWTTLGPEQLRFRHAEKGDRIRPIGSAGSTLLSKVMKDAKLSRAEKERALVATTSDTGEILWVEGLKRSADYLIADGCIRAYRYRRATGKSPDDKKI